MVSKSGWRYLGVDEGGWTYFMDGWLVVGGGWWCVDIFYGWLGVGQEE